MFTNNTTPVRYILPIVLSIILPINAWLFPLPAGAVENDVVLKQIDNFQQQLNNYKDQASKEKLTEP